MTMEARERANELKAMAANLPHGPSQVALLEEAVQLADSVNDIDLAYELREELMTAAVFSGRENILFVAFSWCVATFDRNPGRFQSHGLLWRYKWVISHLIDYPAISRARLDELMVDMERRYRDAGSTMYAHFHLQRKLYERLGERQLAKSAHARFGKCRRDDLSDCEACVASSNCDYHSFQGQWSRAVKAAQPVLDGRLRCTEQPHVTLSTVLQPLLRLGRLEEAKQYQRQSYALIRGDSTFIQQHAEQMEFLALIGDLSKAKSIFERHSPAGCRCANADDRFHFFMSARLWTERLLMRKTHRLKIRLPEGLPKPDASGKTDVRVLGDWFLSQAQEIAQQFDSRNGTGDYQRRIDGHPELMRLAID